MICPDMYINNDILYLDYAATTPTDKRVVDVMVPFFVNKFGNAASRTHFFGQEASDAVKQAREQVANLISAEKDEDIIFTSGATEAINLAIIGMFEASGRKNFHMITSETEHKAILDTCAYIERYGGEVTYLKVDKRGLISLDDLRSSFKENTKLVSIMFVNNETGVINPIEKIASITHEQGSLFFSDATQAVGKLKINVKQLGIDLLASSAHKLYGPNGVGALYIDRNIITKNNLLPHIHGGGHEGGYRSGTLNTPGIVGFGKACEIASKEMDTDYANVLNIRNAIIDSLKDISGFELNIDLDYTSPYILNFHFGEIDAEAIIIQLKHRLALSNGSACTSKEIKPSHVLMAMYNDANLAYASLRLSLGKFSKTEDISYINESFISVIKELEAYQ